MKNKVKELTRAEIKEKVKAKYLHYLELIDEIGNGCLYLKDLFHLQEDLQITGRKIKNKGYEQVAKDMQRLVNWEVLGDFTRSGKKVVHLKYLGNVILNKDHKKELRAGTNKLIMSSMATQLYKMKEMTYWNHKDKVKELHDALVTTDVEIGTFWKDKRELFFDTGKSKNANTFVDLENRNIFLKEFKLTNPQSSSGIELEFIMIAIHDMSIEKLLKHLEDIAHFWENLISEYKVTFTLYTHNQFSTEGFNYVLKRYKLTRGLYYSKSMREAYIKNIKNRYVTLNITHTD